VTEDERQEDALRRGVWVPTFCGYRVIDGTNDAARNAADKEDWLAVSFLASVFGAAGLFVATVFLGILAAAMTGWVQLIAAALALTALAGLFACVRAASWLDRANAQTARETGERRADEFLASLKVK
jgi:hypothetical protein